MDSNWLLQTIIGHYIDGLLVLAGAAVMGYLRHKNVQWLPIFLYSLCGAGLVSVFIFTFTGRAVLSPPPVTTSSVCSNLRSWLDAFDVSVERGASPGSKCDYLIRFQNGNALEAVQSADRDKYVVLRADLIPVPEEIRRIKELSQDEKASIQYDLTLELMRTNVEFSVESLARIHIQKVTPVVALAEDSFPGLIEDMNNAEAIARNVIGHDLYHHSQTDSKGHLQPAQ